MSTIFPPGLDTYRKAADLLATGAIVVLPTETVYGLAARADASQAVEKIYHLKKRPFDKPLPICLTRREQAWDYCQVNALARSLMDKFWPGPLTLVLPKRRGAGSLALRLPDAAWVSAFASAGFDRPLVLSSANISGTPPPLSVQNISPEIVAGLGMIIDGGLCPNTRASTILRVSGRKLELLRAGALPGEALAPYSITGAGL